MYCYQSMSFILTPHFSNNAIYKKTIEIAVSLAVMQYNKGAGALADAVSSLGVLPGKPLVVVAEKLDAIRIRVAEDAAKAETKTSRKLRAMQKLCEDVQLPLVASGEVSMQLEGTETECCIISETFDVFVLGENVSKCQILLVYISYLV